MFLNRYINGWECRRFAHLYPLIITDNGSEFSNPKRIECGPDGNGFERTKIYYCNPSAPYQKAEIEVGHEFIRRVLPKGKSPYEAFCFYYGKDLADRLGCHEVTAKDINLKPSLLKK